MDKDTKFEKGLIGRGLDILKDLKDGPLPYAFDIDKRNLNGQKIALLK